MRNTWQSDVTCEVIWLLVLFSGSGIGAIVIALLGVSKQALSIRMTQLELIEHNDFHNPYAAIDIEYE